MQEGISNEYTHRAGEKGWIKIRSISDGAPNRCQCQGLVFLADMRKSMLLIEVEKRDYKNTILTWIWSARRSATLWARLPPLLILELIFHPPWFLIPLVLPLLTLDSWLLLNLFLFISTLYLYHSNLWNPDAPGQFNFHLWLDCPSFWKLPLLILDHPFLLLWLPWKKSRPAHAWAKSFAI